ncbi:MAG TPA: hypothetical protein VHI99_07885 [Vicinamibacterales bacterium]|nr:hypothetical protein [Vicinamibacterales bacterium]
MIEGLETPLRLTAIALLLRPAGPWFVRPGVLAIAVLVLLSGRVLRAPLTWGILAILIATRIADDWPLSDNHIYLLVYWCLAIALALPHENREEVLARSSRWLLGLAFAFAVLWKAVLSPDYVDGRFFRVTLLTDPRFSDAALLIGRLTPEQLAHDQQALQPLPDGAQLLTPPEIVETPQLRRLAAMATWGGLFLESAVALAMLLPSWRRDIIRHVLLLTFCLVTYALAPVAGFGWLLVVMGLALIHDDWPALRRIYVAVFIVVLFYSEVPWAALMRGAGG